MQCSTPAADASPTALNRGLDRLSQALTEVRRISHGLRPALLDDFGLAPAIELLAEEASEQGPLQVWFETEGVLFALPLAESTVAPGVCISFAEF